MAFKSVEQFNDDRYRNLFRLVNNGDSADVVFLYQSMRDMLVADVHYVKSAEYSGYVHCIGDGCPACAKGLRVQTKLFIPVYNINKGTIEFWDRTMKFEPQMEKDVFQRFPNPSEYVFRITRHGEPNDINTTYEITAVGRNSAMPYQQILTKCNATMPEYYENIVKTVSYSDLTRMLSAQNTESSAVTQDYVPVPRAGYQSSIPNTFVNAAEAVDIPSVEPSVDTMPEPDFVDATDDDGGNGDGDTELPNPIF